MTADNGCFYRAPTLFERFWRWVGFRYHLGDEPPDHETLPGWMRTDSIFVFGWSDRLRLLLTGQLRTTTIVYSDTPSPMVTKTRLDWRIVPPGERL